MRRVRVVVAVASRMAVASRLAVASMLTAATCRLLAAPLMIAALAAHALRPTRCKEVMERLKERK